MYMLWKKKMKEKKKNKHQAFKVDQVIIVKHFYS